MNQSGAVSSVGLPADITAQLSSQHPQVMFRTPEEEEEEQEEIERPPPHRLGRLTIKYDRRELQRRLDIEQWIETELQLLFNCDQEEEEVPELHIDIDELLDVSDSDQRSRLNDFINDLLIRIRGLRRMKK
ncbi:protein phosphatase 1 regulatory subunit 14C-like isoform X2 [Epinephelus fuscoguttatus]|uniref:protein phosphatase 1 regulatory subunit 14C-like isoform X2 n=1 Tax=Epinephelus fuscoguttatus TaxID=293821 RepID=UPI0020CFFF1E|nr:protein phosphatase 1 regulatory subunit 14C-like isoform X2 [Epinephelus fuscoguttatus]